MRPKPSLSVPVLLAAPWMGRIGENSARFLTQTLALRPGVETDLLDMRSLVLPDAPGTSLREPTLEQTLRHADALLLLAPEYGRGYADLLKNALVANGLDRRPRAVGLCGLACGAFQGAQALEELLPALRTLGLVALSQDIHFSAGQDTAAGPCSSTQPVRTGCLESFLEELLWMAAAMRHGRRKTAPPGTSMPRMTRTELISGRKRPFVENVSGK